MPFYELVSRRRRTRVSAVVLTLGTLFTFVTCKLNDLISPTSVTTTKPTVALGVDSVVTIAGTVKMSATVSAPGGTVSASSYGIAWSVNNPSLATIASDGTLTGVSIGSVQVTARVVAPELGDNGPTATTSVRVGYAGIKITPVDSLRAIGATRAMVVSGLDAKGNSVATVPAAQLTYTVRDTTVMKVDANGVLTARKSATTYVLASLNGLTDSAAVKVRQVAKTANFGGATTLFVGSLNKARTITVNGVDSTGNTIPAGIPVVAWSVNNTATATIGASTGSLTALKVDTTTITAVVDGVAAKILMSVQQVPATITKVAGDARSDVVNQAVSVLPKLTVVDSGGTAIAKDTVVFTVSSGAGSVTNGTQVTDATGTVTVGGWTLGPTATAQTLLATTGPASATFTVTGTPLAAKKLIFVTQPPTAAATNQLGSFQVAVADSLGNVVTTAAATSISLALGANPGSGAIGGTVTATTTAGVASFSTITISQGGTGYTLVASGGGYAAATSNPFTIYGTKTKLAVTTQPQSARKGQVLQAVAISIEDANGNVVGNATDSVAIAIATSTGATGAHLTGTTKVAAVAGVARFTTLVIDSVGQASTGNPYKLTATSGSLTPATSNAFDIKPVGTAAQLAFTVQPVSTTAGATLASISVAVEDSGGGIVTTATNSVTLGIQTGPGSIASGTTTATTLTNGVATFSNIIINKVGTGYSFNAVASGLTTAVSNTFAITAPTTGTKLVFVQQPYNAGASQAIAPAVTVALEDNFGNIITTDTNSVTLAITSGTGGTGATLTGGGTAHPSSGVATFSGLSIGTIANGYTLTATASGRSNGVSSSFNIVAATGTAMKFAFTTQPNNVTAGSAMSPSIVVVAQDAAGNTVSATGNVSLSVASGPSTTINSGATASVTGGTATFSNTVMNVAGTYTLQATGNINGLAMNPATSTSFVVSPGAKGKIVFLNSPTTSVAGTPVSASTSSSCTALCVAVEDNIGAGNVVTGDNTDQITLNVSGGTPSSIAGTTTVQVQNGIANFSNVRVRTAGTSVVLNAITGSLGTPSSAFTVTAAPEYGVAFKTQPTSIVQTTTYASGSQIQVQLVDSVGNLISTATDSVKLSIATGPSGGTISGTATVAAVNGVATFPNVSFSTVGTYVLTASSGTLATATSNSFSVTSSGSTTYKLVITSQPSGSIAAGTSMGVTVTVEDVNNAVYTGAVPTIFLSLSSNPGSANLNGTTSINPTNGVATVSNLQITKIGTGYTIQATASGLTSGISTAFNIVPAAASQLAFTTSPQQTGYGIGQTIAVAIEDQYGNVVTTNSTTSVSLTTNPSVTPVNGAGPVTASSGVATFNGFALEPAGTYAVIASASGFSSITSNSFVVSAPGTVASNSPTAVTDVTASYGGGVVIVGSTAYWTNQNSGSLYSASIYGGTVTTLKTGLGIIGAPSSDGAGHLFWCVNGNLSTSYIARYNISAGTVDTVVSGTSSNNATPGQFHVDNDGTNLYFAANNGGWNIYRIAATATKQALSAAAVLTSTGGIPTFTYSTGTGTPTIFYADGAGAIKEITNPSTGTNLTPTTLVSSGASAYVDGFAAVGSNLYWADASGGTNNGNLYEVSLSGGSVSNPGAYVGMSKLTTDGTNLYMAKTGQGLFRITVSSLANTTLGGSPTGARIAISGNDVYWTDTNGILKTAK